MKNCTVIRDSAAPPRSENILIEGNKIAGFTEKDSFPGFTAKDLGGKVVIPGFVQTHVHLCQVMFRGLADDLSLLDWLKKKDMAS